MGAAFIERWGALWFHHRSLQWSGFVLTMSNPSTTAGAWVLTIPQPRERHLSIRVKERTQSSLRFQKRKPFPNHTSQSRIYPPTSPPSPRGPAHPQTTVTQTPFLSVVSRVRFARARVSKAQTHLAGTDSARHNTRDMTLCILPQPSLHVTCGVAVTS